jgi:hypothetical protein
MKGKVYFLLLLVFSSVLLVLPQPPLLGETQVIIEGTVREHQTGSPVPHAILLVYKSIARTVLKEVTYEWIKVFQGEADPNGSFVIELPIERAGYILYAYYDAPSTPGFDYVPSRKRISASLSGKVNATLELWDGASLLLDGEAFFADTAETPKSSYLVLEPSSGELMQFGEYPLRYGEKESPSSVPNLNDLLGISQKNIVIPANTTFIVRVDCEVKIEGGSLRRSFLVDQPNHFTLGKGETAHIDLRAFCLPSSLSMVENMSAEIGVMLEEREREGFYVAVERQGLAQVISLTFEADNYLDQGLYNVSSAKLREAYLDIMNLRSWLNSMQREALTSVFFLILFLAFTATTTSYLLFEKKIYKTGGSLALYAALLPVFYLLYPGSRLVEASLFLGVALISLVAVLGVAAGVPKVLKGREVKGYVPLRNLVVPVFSIAKRSLRRRRLRFALTLFSVVTLVSSFIALTSFATGYGLAFSQVSSQQSPLTGVLVRAPKPPTAEEEGISSPFKVVIGGGLVFPSSRQPVHRMV